MVWVPGAAGVALVFADGVYLADTRSGHLSFPLAVPPLLIAAALILVASAALSIADWTAPASASADRRSGHVCSLGAAARRLTAAAGATRLIGMVRTPVRLQSPGAVWEDRFRTVGQPDPAAIVWT